MITVTEAARERFRTIALAAGFEGEVMRLGTAKATANGDGPELAVYLGEPQEGDQLVEHRGEALLYVSRTVSAAFDGCVVDLVETPEGVSFAIGSPGLGR
jgi:Fe-S cluster assembly iron-binding protein IscA